MISLTPRKLPPQVLVWAAVTLLGGPTALSQNSNSLTAPAATPPGQTAEPQPAAVRPPITVLEDTLIRVMTNEPVNSKRAEHGTPLLFTVSEDVVAGDVLAIPRGATVHGVVIKSKKAGELTGSPELKLKLVS